MWGERRRRSGPSLAWPEGFGAGDRNRAAVLVLSALRGTTPRRSLEAAQRWPTAAACLAAVRAGEVGSEADISFARALHPARIAASIRACGATTVVVGDEAYPPQLHHLVDPPLALFVRGRPLPGGDAMVAVVGARNCTETGRDIARLLGSGLGAAGLVVVSGAARGIDAAAHEGALSAAAHTVAVMGCGIDEAYPAATRRLVDRILGSGTVVSEYAPGVPPEPFRFPARNRIIAALARALVVVEGEAGSGSLISAEHALDLGRDVFAVPGAVASPLSHAPHALIREGAGLIRDPEDLLADLGVGVAGAPEPLPLGLTLAERAAFDAVAGQVLPERVARRLEVSVPEALALLLGLEMRGLIRSVGGRFERRVRAPA